MATESRQKRCTKCSTELVNAQGIHMGIPFGHWTFGTRPASRVIICAKCYDEITIKDNVQRTGEEVT